MIAVKKIETLSPPWYDDSGKPFWRIVLNGYCADFPTEEAARNFANQIAAVKPAATEADSASYCLVLSEKQADLIWRALELDARLALGQFEHILEHRAVHLKVTGDNRSQADYLLNDLKVILFGFVLNASHGIHSESVPDTARQAWDILKVIRHRLAWDRHNLTNPGQDTKPFGVYFDEPRQISGESLPTIERI